MGIVDALIIAVSGFGTVMLMLSLLWAIIVIINKVVMMIEGTKKEDAPLTVKELSTEPAAAPAHSEEMYGGEIALYGVDEKTAACIMAIISDETKIPLSQLIFKSIKALN